MNVYYYIFYRIYSLADRTSLSWWTDFRVTIFIAFVQMSILALAEYKIASTFMLPGADILGKWGYILLITMPPLVLNYFLFLYRNKWKEIIYYYDNSDRKEKSNMNLKMSIVIFIIISFFVLLLFL